MEQTGTVLRQEREVVERETGSHVVCMGSPYLPTVDPAIFPTATADMFPDVTGTHLSMGWTNSP